jgi:hypothetical protein
VLGGEAGAEDNQAMKGWPPAVKWLRRIGFFAFGWLGVLSLVVGVSAFIDAYRYYDRSCKAPPGGGACFRIYLGRQPSSTSTYLIVGTAASLVGFAIICYLALRLRRARSSPSESGRFSRRRP